MTTIKDITEATQAINAVEKTVAEFKTYSAQELDPNYFSLGAFLVAQGKILCASAGFEVNEKTNPIKARFDMDSKESAACFIGLQKMRKIPTKHKGNKEITYIIHQAILQFEESRMDEPQEFEAAIYNLLASALFAAIHVNTLHPELKENGGY